MNSPEHCDDSLRRRVCTAAEGYLDLGLPELAREELALLPPSQSSHPEVMELRLAILMRSRAWEAAAEEGLAACQIAPEHTRFFIHTAYCLHELGRTGDARRLLLSGPEALRRDPLYHYNMGCYLAVMGLKDEARAFLERAIAMDHRLRAFARTDPDLAGMQNAF